MQIILIEPIAKTLERSRDFWSNGHLAQRQLFKSWSRSNKEMVVCGDSCPRGRGFESRRWRDHFSCIIHLDQSMDEKCWKL